MDHRDTELLKQYNGHWGDMLNEAASQGIAFSTYLQRKFPFPDSENDPVSAIASLCQRLGITLRDDPTEGAISSTLGHIFEDDLKANAWVSAVQENYVRHFKGWRNLSAMEQLAYSLDEFTPGSAYREYTNNAPRDDDKFRGWPPLASIVASVNRAAGNDIKILEYVTNEAAETSVNWDGHSDIPVEILDESETPVKTKYLAGGIAMTQELRRSNLTSEKIMIRVDKASVRDMQIIADEVLVKIAEAAPATGSGIDVGLSNADLDTGVITGIATAFTRQRKQYRIDRLIGRYAKVEDYLNLDRSKFNSNSGSETTQGAVVGSDRYGDRGVDRIIYDVPTDQVPSTDMASHEFIGWDVNETAEVHVVAGSQSMVEENIVRNRSWNLTWTMKYATNLLVSAPKSILLFE